MELCWVLVGLSAFLVVSKSESPPVIEPPSVFLPHPACQQPKVVGDCKGKIEKYYHKSGRCVKFMYSGCGGNGNKFDNRKACQDACIGQKPELTDEQKKELRKRKNKRRTRKQRKQNTAPEEVCGLPKMVGPCRAAHKRYFYNKDTEKCEEFMYGGCNGNKNNFSSKRTCKRTCYTNQRRRRPKASNAAREPPSNPPQTIGAASENVCEQPKQVGPCRAAHKRYFYNQGTKECEEFTYGGCNGNKNNFLNKRACQRTCSNKGPQSRPTQGDTEKPESKPPQTNDFDRICNLPKKTGPCRKNLARFFYNKETGVCEAFVFGGCKGNANNFKTIEDCINICKKTVGKNA